MSNTWYMTLKYYSLLRWLIIQLTLRKFQVNIYFSVFVCLWCAYLQLVVVTMCSPWHSRKYFLMYLFTLLTYFMEQSLFEKPSGPQSSSSSIVWNLKVHYHIYKCPTPIPTLSQINPVHAVHSTSWRSSSVLSSHLCLGLPSGLFPSGFHTKTL